MAHLSDYLENKVLEHVLGKTAYGLPGVWLALFTAAPSDSGGGTEVSGGSYARLATSAADWATASAGASSNANALAFATASAGWGTVSHFGAYDSSSGGNLLWWNALTAPRSVTNGDQARFAAAALTVTAD